MDLGRKVLIPVAPGLGRGHRAWCWVVDFNLLLPGASAPSASCSVSCCCLVPAAFLRQGEKADRNRPRVLHPTMPSEILKGLSVTFPSMFRKRNTVQYLEEKRPTSPRFHGRHQLNRLPRRPGAVHRLRAVRLRPARPTPSTSRGPTTPRRLRCSVGERYAAHLPDQLQLRCIFCGLCIEACPTRALTHDQRVRAVVADPRGPDLRQASTCWPSRPPGPSCPAARRDAEDGPPAIARYGPAASLSQESRGAGVGAAARQETRQADRELPDAGEAPGDPRLGRHRLRAGRADRLHGCSPWPWSTRLVHGA